LLGSIGFTINSEGSVSFTYTGYGWLAQSLLWLFMKNMLGAYSSVFTFYGSI